MNKDLKMSCGPKHHHPFHRKIPRVPRLEDSSYKYVSKEATDNFTIAVATGIGGFLLYHLLTKPKIVPLEPPQSDPIPGNDKGDALLSANRYNGGVKLIIATNAKTSRAPL